MLQYVTHRCNEFKLLVCERYKEKVYTLVYFESRALCLRLRCYIIVQGMLQEFSFVKWRLVAIPSLLKI
jgi:hypothetical protein